MINDFLDFCIPLNINTLMFYEAYYQGRQM